MEAERKARARARKEHEDAISDNKHVPKVPAPGQVGPVKGVKEKSAKIKIAKAVKTRKFVAAAQEKTE